MGTWEVRVVDKPDKAVARRMWEIGRDAEQAHRPYDLYWPWEFAWDTFSGGRSDTRVVLLGAYDGDELCGMAQLDHPLTDNTHAVFAEFFVHPDHQRRGAGRALVEAAARLVADAGRRTVIVEAYAPVEGHSAALAFARATGFRESLEEGMKVADLVATEHTWPALAAAAAPHHADYRLETWHDVAPAHLVGGLCDVYNVFNLEAPMGELELEEEHWDETRVREREARNRRIGRRDVTTVAVAPDGTVVGYTEVVVNEAVPWRSFQSGTLVLKAHRGHRLGIAMKVANQVALRERWPDATAIFTGNAGVNAPMNAVNDQLGFRLYERCVEVQRDL